MTDDEPLQESWTVQDVKANQLTDSNKVGTKIANSVLTVANETPRPDYHNARRLAWRTYVCALRSNDIEWRMASADNLVTAEEQRFGEIK